MARGAGKRRSRRAEKTMLPAGQLTRAEARAGRVPETDPGSSGWPRVDGR